MRHLICGLLPALLAAYSPHSVGAASAFSYEGFAANVARLETMTLSFCRRHAADVIDTTGVLGSVDDPVNFRMACGRGLADKSVGGLRWTHFYHQQDSLRGALDVLGAMLPLTHGRQSYRLIIGMETRTTRRHEQPEIVQSRPVATVFGQRDGQWWPAWQYVDPLRPQFHRPDGIPDPDLARFLDQIWRRHVTFGLQQLIQSLNDVSGPRFPN